MGGKGRCEHRDLKNGNNCFPWIVVYRFEMWIEAELLIGSVEAPLGYIDAHMLGVHLHQYTRTPEATVDDGPQQGEELQPACKEEEEYLVRWGDPHD